MKRELYWLTPHLRKDSYGFGIGQSGKNVFTPFEDNTAAARAQRPQVQLQAHH